MPNDEIETDSVDSIKFTIKDGTEVSIEDIKRLYEINKEQQVKIEKLHNLLEKAVASYEKKIVKIDELEHNIAELKRDLDMHVNMINNPRLFRIGARSV